MVTLEQILEQAEKLSAEDKAKLVNKCCQALAWKSFLATT